MKAPQPLPARYQNPTVNTIQTRTEMKKGRGRGKKETNMAGGPRSSGIGGREDRG
jgi:hypothetical protein